MMLGPLPLAPPVNPPVTEGIGQLYVVAIGTIPFVMFTGIDVKPVPLQIVSVILETAGVGFTVTVTVKVSPKQKPDVGVTV